MFQSDTNYERPCFTHCTALILLDGPYHVPRAPRVVVGRILAGRALPARDVDAVEQESPHVGRRTTRGAANFWVGDSVVALAEKTAVVATATASAAAAGVAAHQRRLPAGVVLMLTSPGLEFRQISA
jgi:hypothetical protein